ncbi:MAG: 7-cyano-7-deazaguanine synthase, partial [Acutalibacteraceae bacterium]|nr:7-cyano-7-deazaguanine synthase [Acutalibacteraceae bacterium]
MEKVLLGMSGGVDSSAAALLLTEQGYDVTGLTLKLCREDKEQDLTDAKAVCEKIGIKHITLDLKKEFGEKVISAFIDDYKNGLTPNPCLECNKYIKFGSLLRFALENGFQKIATGHYARVEQQGDRFILKKAADISKDQSYVLYSLTQHQ